MKIDKAKQKVAQAEDQAVRFRSELADLGGMMNCQSEMKKAVECGYWNLFRFNPALETGKFILDSKEPAGGYQEFLMNEARYNRLTREFPERAKVLFAKNEEAAKERYEHLLKLKAMYAE